MRALLRPLAPVAASLLLMSLVAPAATGPAPARAAALTLDSMPVAMSARAAPLSRRLAREVPDAFADLAPAIDLSAGALALAKIGEAAARLQAVAPTPTPVPTPRPTPVPQPPRAAPPAAVTAAIDADAERRMLVLINASRAEGGLVPLVMEEALTLAARAHSEVESRYGYVYHDGPDGTARSRYVPVCGNGWYGENTGKVWQSNVARLHVEFMSEPWIPINHRTNIMDPNFRRIGIGAVQGRDALYMTMVFCR